MANPAENYEYAELINLIHSLEANQFRLIEAQATNSVSMKVNTKRLQTARKLAAKRSVERGIEIACTDMGIEPKTSKVKSIVGILAFSIVVSIIVFAIIAFSPETEAVESLVTLPSPVEVIPAVAEPETSVIETAQATVKPVRVLTSTDGKPTADQIQTVREICLVGWDEKYSGQMTEKNLDRDGFAKYCVADLLAIAKLESSFNADAENVSDIEKSYGAYQINRNIHRHVTIEQAKSFEFAAAWTLDRIISYGWPVLRTRALACHQGCNSGTDYAAKAKIIAQNYLQ